MRGKLVFLCALALQVQSWVSASQQQNELQFLQDYIAHNHVTRMIAIANQGNKEESKILEVWYLHLDVLMKVLPVKGVTDAMPVESSDLFEMEESPCIDRCASYLVVARAYNQQELDTFMMQYEKGQFRRVFWLVFGGMQLKNDIKQLYLAMDNKITFAVASDEMNGFDLWEGFKPAPDLRLRSEIIGSWSSEKGLNNSLSREPFSRRKDLTGYVLRVITLEMFPFTVYLTDVNGKRVLAGNHGAMLQLLQSTLNFTADIIDAPVKSFGSYNPETGTMDGMIGELNKGNADIAVHSFDITPIREQFCDYALPIDQFGYKLKMKKPGQGTNWKTYTAEFSFDSWFIILFVFASFVFIISFFSRTSPEEYYSGISDTAMLVISVVCNVGIVGKYRNFSTRIVLASFFMTTIIVYTYYTSYLTALLAVQKVRLPFSDLQGLHAKRSDWRFGTMAGIASIDQIKDSQDPFLKKIWTDFLAGKPEDIVAGNEEAIVRMRSHKYVYMSYAPHDEYPHDIISVSKKQYFITPMSWPLQPHSPFLPIINYQLLQWWETAQYRKLKGNEVQTTKASSPTSLGYNQVFTAFGLLGFGMICSAAVLAFELIGNTLVSTA